LFDDELSHLNTIYECDRQTDGHVVTTHIALCIASRDKTFTQLVVRSRKVLQPILFGETMTRTMTSLNRVLRLGHVSRLSVRKIGKLLSASRRRRTASSNALVSRCRRADDTTFGDAQKWPREDGKRGKPRRAAGRGERRTGSTLKRQMMRWHRRRLQRLQPSGSSERDVVKLLALTSSRTEGESRQQKRHKDWISMIALLQL